MSGDGNSTRHKRIWFWDDEREIGNSLIVMLRPGWKFSADPLGNEHTRGFDTVSEAMREVRSAIPCSCAECRVSAEVDRAAKFLKAMPLTSDEAAQ